MAVDAAMRKLKVPPRYMPYMEKHRIYELFHDFGNQLAMEQPKDPIQFLKHCLERLEKGERDRRLILLLAPPYLDRIRLSHLISVKTGCGILTRYLVCLRPGNHHDAGALATNTANIIKTTDKTGWILADYPDTEVEAKRLIQAGVLPTHAFLFLAENKNPKDEKPNIRSIETTPSLLLEFDNSIFRLRELFKSSLKIINIHEKGLEDLADSCARLTMKMPPRFAPKLFRVALLGPRGSKRRTLAKLLHQKFKLVHVDMENLLSAVRKMENAIGDKIRYFDKHGFFYPNTFVYDLLKVRLYQKDCLEFGYTLTNFPCCIEDFVFLDSTDTPPNKVIFLTIDNGICQARLGDRVVNMYTGDLNAKSSLDQSALWKSQTHPDDEACRVKEDLKFYNERVGSMMAYCGETKFLVDASGPLTKVLERVESVLMSASPASKPRTGKLPPTQSLKKTLRGSSEVIRLTYPLSRTQVLPLVDSEELLKRFTELKKGLLERDRYVGDFEGKEVESSISSLCESCKRIMFINGVWLCDSCREKEILGLESIVSVVESVSKERSNVEEKISDNKREPSIEQKISLSKPESYVTERSSVVKRGSSTEKQISGVKYDKPVDDLSLCDSCKKILSSDSLWLCEACSERIRFKDLPLCQSCENNMGIQR